MKNIGITSDIKPNMFEFRSTSNNSWVMRITADRRIEVNEDVDVTEAAQKVLAAMQHLLQTKREWIGLTEEDVDLILGTMSFAKPKDFAKVVEAKLKERNA